VHELPDNLYRHRTHMRIGIACKQLHGMRQHLRFFRSARPPYSGHMPKYATPSLARAHRCRSACPSSRRASLAADIGRETSSSGSARQDYHAASQPERQEALSGQPGATPCRRSSPGTGQQEPRSDHNADASTSAWLRRFSTNGRIPPYALH
jgi:hypothetical protein